MTLRKVRPLPWTIIGIDNGLRLAGVLSPGGQLTKTTLHTLAITVKDVGLRCRQAMEWSRELVTAAQRHGLPVYVFVESPFISPKTISAAIPLARIQGAVMAGAQLAGATAVYEIAPSQWKKHVIGSGNASKSDIMEWMRVNWPWVHQWTIATIPAKLHQDTLDAAGVALYGINTMRRSRPTTGNEARVYANL